MAAKVISMRVEFDDDGVISGMRSYKDEADKTGKSLADAGKRGTDGFNGIESAERRAHIAGQLFTRTTGVEMPRALETVISRSQTMGPLLEKAFSVGIVLAGAAAVVEFGKKIFEATEAAGGLTEEVKKSIEEFHKANQERFLNQGNLDRQKQTINQLTTQQGIVQKLRTSEDARNAALVQQYGTVGKIGAAFGMQATIVGKIKETSKQLTQSQEASAENTTKLTEEKLHNEVAIAEAQNKGNEAGLKGYVLLQQQVTDQKKLIEAKRTAVTIADPQRDEKLKQIDAEEVSAHKETLAQLRELDRQNALETRHIHEQALQLDLHDEDLIRAQEQARIEDLDDALRQGLIRRQDYETRVAAAHAEANERIKQQDIALMRSQEETNHFIEQRAEVHLAGSAKVVAGLGREIAALEEEREAIKKLYGDEITYKRLQDEKNIGLKTTAIWNDVTEQIKEAEGQRMDEIKQLQQEAALAAVPEWQRATAAIQKELDNRLAAVTKEENKEIDSWKRVAAAQPELQQVADQEINDIEQKNQAKRVAIWAEANMRIREEQKHQIEQLGGELDTLFSDIGSGNLSKRILGNLKKMFAQMVAAWMLSLNIMKTGFGSMMGSLVFGPGSMGANVMGGNQGGGGFGFGNLIGGLFGGGGSAPAGAGGVPGTPPFIPSGAGGGGLFSLGGGGGAAGAVSAAGGVLAGGGMGLPGVGGGSLFGSLTSSPLGGSGSDATGGVSLPQRALGGLGGLFGKGAGMSGLAGLGIMAGAIAGGLGGGTPGMIGGTFASLILMAALNPTGPAAALLGHMGFSFAGGGVLSALAGPIAGGLIGFGVGTQHGAVAGGLSGALSGAGIGFLFGGPIGALVGGIIGALGGIFGGIFGGSKRKKQANNLVDQQELPAIQKIKDAYDSFQLDSASAIQQLEQLRTDTETQLKKLKGEGKSVLRNRAEPAIDQAEQYIKNNDKERQRRASLVFAPEEFHDGGLVDATKARWLMSPMEPLITAKHGEFVVNPVGTARNLNTLLKMNAGEDIDGSGGDTHFHGDMHFHGPFDEKWLRSKGVYQIRDAMARLAKEGK